jgi:translation initiation factor IF-3
MNKSSQFFCRINEQIREREVRIVGENVESKIVKIEEALSIARGLELDLIEINKGTNPPICKIMDYQKFLYQERKKQKDKEKKDRENRMDVKEVRFGVNTAEHDYEFKMKHTINFLKNGDKVKSSVFFKGREIQFRAQGEIMLLKLAEDVKEYGSPESLPRLEGKRLIMSIIPKKK